MALQDIHIGFDLDGVLIDHSEQKQTLARQAGFSVRPEQTASMRLEHLIPNPQYRQLQQLLYADPDISLRSPLMKGARDVLQALRDRGVRFTLVSRRRDPVWAERILEHHGLRPAYFTDDNTFFVTKPEEKNHVALRVDITHYLDDEVKVLRALEDVPNRYLMDPHGTYAPTPLFSVVRSLGEFLERVSAS